MRYYYVTPEGKAIIKKVATTKERLSINDCYRIIECDTVENAGTRFGGKSCNLVLDENGKWMGRMLNPVGSYLLNRAYDCVAGIAIVTKTNAWRTFTEEQAAEFDKCLKESIMSIEIVEEAE